MNKEKELLQCNIKKQDITFLVVKTTITINNRKIETYYEPLTETILNKEDIINTKEIESTYLNEGEILEAITVVNKLRLLKLFNEINSPVEKVRKLGNKKRKQA